MSSPDNTSTTAIDYAGSKIKGRPQASWTMYNDMGWVTYRGNVGTNGGSNFDRDTDASTSPSDTNLVTAYTYNDDGTVLDVTDPRGLVTRTLYDSLGRKTATIANYTGSTPPITSEARANDLYTRYAYTSGLMTAMWVDMRGDDSDGVPPVGAAAQSPADDNDQVTTYIYGGTSGTPSQMKIANGNLLRAVKYPDTSNTGTAYTDIDSDSSDVVSYAYNAQGQRVYTKDQAGNVIENDYDTAGRQTERRVTTLAGGFDGAVKRIETAYLSRGLVDTVTQYDNATVGSGSVTDQVEYTYDKLGNVTAFKQDVDSVIGGSGRASFEVDYTYSVQTPGGGRQTSRRETMVFPDSTTVTYGYGSGGSIEDTYSRVLTLSQSSVKIATYDYLGAGQVVTTNLNQAGVSSSVFSSGSSYPDLDNFNRVIESVWTRVANFYDVTVSYDRNSGITRGVDAVQTAINGDHIFDTAYTNDNLNRLSEAKEGKWNGSAITGATRDEQWTLSQTGNWANRKLDLNGDGDFTDANELNDTGTFTKANEWSTRDTDSNSSVNYTLAYDSNGNMTDDGQSYKYVWDAFGRLVTAKNQSSAVVAEYKYNGLGYRIGWHYDVTQSGGGAPDGTVDSNDPWYYFCYDDRWRIVATYRASDSSPKERFVYHNAGANGLGGSSYIDLVVLRDRDANTNWYSASDGTLEERNDYCQNWRGDVVVITDSGGQPIEFVHYSAYGVPSSYALADLDHNGVIDGTGAGTDYADWYAIEGGSGASADINFDGDIGTGDDDTAFFASYNDASTGGVGVLSRSKTANRIGYAGYQEDLATGNWIAGYRWDAPALGRWLTRDMLRLIDGPNDYSYVRGRPLAKVDPLGLCTSCVTSAKPGMGDVHTIEACQSDVEWCEQNDPVVKDLLKQIADCGQGGFTLGISCGIPHLQDDPKKNEGEGGNYSCHTRSITIWAGRNGGRAGTCMTVAHELSHALDDCQDGGHCYVEPIDPNTGDSRVDCNRVACTEIRAYNRSGQCCAGGSLRGNYRDYCSCIRGTAEWSTAHGFIECKDNAANYVRDNLRSCLDPTQAPSECQTEARQCIDQM